jgi:uncharacterized protein
VKLLKVVPAFVAVLAAAVLLLPAAAQGQAERHKVVLQVSDNDPAKWNLALNNARNLQGALGKENVSVEIVAYGPGLNMLKTESKVADRLAHALDNDVGLLACENTMRNTKTEKAELYGGIGFVGSGVVHIIKRQREGWAYVRP